MSADRAKVLDRLKKLRAHAQSAHELKSQEEAASFANMVQAMIVKHNIDQSELDSLEQEEELKLNPMKEIPMDWKFGHKHRQRKAWLENLAMYVAHAHFCDILISQQRFYVFFCGREVQAQMASDIFVKLATTAEKLAQAEYFKHYHEVRGNSAYASIKGFKPAYLEAFVSRLGKRYRDKMDELQNDINASAGAMVLFKSEKQQLKEFIEELLSPKKPRVKKIENIFLEFKYEIKPSLKRHWQMGWRWGVVLGDKILASLHNTEIEAVAAMEEEHGYKEPRGAAPHHEGSKRGKAAADKLDLGHSESKSRKQLED